MRWELLFADLEAQAEASEQALFDVEAAELGRAERSALRLLDRLDAHREHELTVWSGDGQPRRHGVSVARRPPGPARLSTGQVNARHPQAAQDREAGASGLRG